MLTNKLSDIKERIVELIKDVQSITILPGPGGPPQLDEVNPGRYRYEPANYQPNEHWQRNACIEYLTKAYQELS